MASCSFTSTGRTFTLNVSESSYSIENNTSNIYWEINISGGGTQWYDTYCKAIVNGSVVFNETKGWGSGVFPAKDGSVGGYIYNIPHDSEGRASVSFYIEGYSEVYSTKSASGSLTLTTIPRATPAPNITCDVENTTSFTLTPYANFSHSVSISFGTINKYLKTDGTLSNSEVKYDTSIRTWNFNADKSYYKQFNKKSGQGSITVRTYSGSTLVGSKSGTLTVVANQALCSPVITGTVIDTNETTKTLTGNENVIIKYKSTPRITTQIQITSPNDDNSTLSYLQVAGNNISDLTQRVFDVQNPTQNSFIVKAINSRDYSTETPLSSTGTFIDYIIPTITITSAKRTEPTTGDATIEYKGDYYNGKFSKTTSNELVVTWKYKEKGVEEYTNGGTITPTIKDNTFSGTINVDGLFNYTKQYDIIVIVTDKLSSTQSVAQIPRGFPIFWWSENFVDILGELRINGANIGGDVLYSETDWELMLVGLDTVSLDLTQYKYIDVYFCSYGFVGGSTTGGNAINDIIRVDLTHPSLNPTLMYDSVDWRYGCSKWYPDAQFFIGSSDDPGFFIEAAFVSADKNKILIGKSGYYVISSSTIQMVYTGDNYLRVSKIVGYK